DHASLGDAVVGLRDPQRVSHRVDECFALVGCHEHPAPVRKAGRGEFERSWNSKFTYLHSSSVAHLSQWTAPTVSGGAATDPSCSPGHLPRRAACGVTTPGRARSDRTSANPVRRTHSGVVAFVSY